MRDWATNEDVQKRGSLAAEFENYWKGITSNPDLLAIWRKKEATSKAATSKAATSKSTAESGQ